MAGEGWWLPAAVAVVVAVVAVVAVVVGRRAGRVAVCEK